MDGILAIVLVAFAIVLLIHSILILDISRKYEGLDTDVSRIKRFLHKQAAERNKRRGYRPKHKENNQKKKRG